MKRARMRVDGTGTRLRPIRKRRLGFRQTPSAPTGSTNLQSFGPNVGSIYDQWTYTYKDVATKIIGRHTIKFGGDLTRLSYLQDCAGCAIPHYNFFNLWDFLNDAAATEFEQVNPTNGAPTALRQDDRENLWGFLSRMITKSAGT